MKPSESLTPEEHSVTDLDCPLAENGTWYPQRSGLRYSFVATIEVVDANSDKQIVSTTSNLSRYGCHVRTSTPFDPGTTVKLTIRHRGTTFQIEGRVVYSISSQGMGIRFDNIDTAEQIILNEWLMQVSSEAPDERLPQGSKESAALRHRRLLIVSAIIWGVTAVLWAWFGVLP